MMDNGERYLLLIIAKAKNEEIENFTYEEINRVFENTVNKKRHIKNFIKLVHQGITKEAIYKFDEVELLEFIRKENYDSIQV